MSSFLMEKTPRMFAFSAVVALVGCAYLIGERNGKAGRSVSMATDLMVWNITKDEITERMAVVTRFANAVEGPTPQPPPDKGRKPLFTRAIEAGEWGPGFNAQNGMLDEFSKKFGLENADWRNQKP